ncbi:MAG TPA: PAS domain-containing sensor histidine kinase [Ktedonobacterales bacterium]|nr:PAS domain-containing sensor histidine kinase [Ktedonobacterales bacterium]
MDEDERSASERQLESTGMELPETAPALVQRIRELATQQVIASEHIVQATDAQIEAMQALNSECQTLLAREHAARGMATAALERAQASEAHFEQLVAANLIGVIVVEADRITEANDAFLRLAGYTREDLEAGRLRWPEVLPPACRQPEACDSTVLQARGTCTPFETQCRRADGRHIPVLVGATVLEREPLCCWVCFVIDLSAQKRLEHERELAKAREAAQRERNQHLDEYFTVAAHDIRHPVHAAQMGVELARRHCEHLAAALAQGRPTEVMMQRLRTSLEVADQGMERLTHLTTVLFDVTQFRHGKLEVQPAPCDLAQLVRDQVAMMQLATPGRTIGVRVPDVGPVPVLADADRVGEVLANYLTNALKFSSDDQPVSVRVKVSGGQATVAVQDRGIGLSLEQQRHVWDAFHQAPEVRVQSRTASAGSVGMGLYACKQIIEAHPGGQMGIDSVVGEGSTFWFTLPLAAVPASEME